MGRRSSRPRPTGVHSRNRDSVSLSLHPCTIRYMESPAPSWLLLIVSLPTSSATARMRIWRALKALGCMPLRDGAYLLPTQAEREPELQELADECIREGGSAWLMAVAGRSPGDTAAYRELFDRAQDYAELRRSWCACKRSCSVNTRPCGPLTSSRASPARKVKRPGPTSANASPACSHP